MRLNTRGDECARLWLRVDSVWTLLRFMLDLW